MEAVLNGLHAMNPRPAGEYRIGLFISVLAHALLFYYVFFMALPSWDSEVPIVYSITLEGGKTIGGIAQVPKDDKPAQMAPAKNINVPEQKTKEASADKDAEVSLADPEAEKKKAEEKRLAEQRAAAAKKKAEEERKKAEEKAKAQKEKQKQAELDREYQKAMQRYTGESTDAGGKSGFGAAKLGGKGMGGGVLRPPEFFTYRDLLKRSIKQGWRWFDTSTSLKALVYFEIAPDGTITNVSVVKGSGNSEYDDSVIRAIYKASPLTPPPSNVYQFFEKVRIEFDPTE